jgi:hypothetical protein
MNDTLFLYLMAQADAAHNVIDTFAVFGVGFGLLGFYF